MSEANPVFVGVDVSKEELVSDYGKSLTVKNAPKGIASLVKTLEKLSPQLVVVESTGGYEDKLMDALWSAGIPVSRVNPRRTKAFSISLGTQAKTDPLDARMLRLFAEQIHPEPTPAPSKAVRQLKPLVDRRTQLVEMITIEKNHLKAPSESEPLKESVKRMLEMLCSELKRLDALILNTINNHSELKEKAELLREETGVGPVLCMTLLADMPELGTIGRNKVAALVGVAPMNNQSGTRDAKRPIRGGRKNVRNVLYMATVAALRRNQHIKNLFLSMVKRGKPKMVALVACMRRLLTILNSKMRAFSPQQIKLAAENG